MLSEKKVSIFKYPEFKTTYPRLYEKGLFRRLPKQIAYQLFNLYHSEKIQELSQAINSDSRLKSLLMDAYKLPQILFEGYITNDYSFTQRHAVLLADLDKSVQIFPQNFFQKKEICLAKINESLDIRLQLNPLSPMEGLWLIGLFSENKRVYLFTFSIGNDNKLVIGSIQGASADADRTLIKSTTKTMYGLRPQQLMIWIATKLVELLELDKVEAIGNHNHPRMNIRKQLRNKQLYKANYDEIWQSYQGEQLINGHWLLPKVELKPIESYPSKKRSMYRKRYAMLDNIEKGLRQNITV